MRNGGCAQAGYETSVDVGQHVTHPANLPTVYTHGTGSTKRDLPQVRHPRMLSNQRLCDRIMEMPVNYY